MPSAGTAVRPVRILLADDHGLMAAGVRALLEPRYDVVGAALDGRAAVDMALALKPDVIILDISMPVINGLDAVRLIKESLPAAKVIILSMHLNAIYLRRALEAGACGYVLKTGAAEELVEAIEAVRDGRTYVTASFGQDVIDTLLTGSGKPVRGAELTERQREILQLLTEGKSNKEIAHATRISVKTVEFHRGRIMNKLGAHSAAELTRIALIEGLLPA